MYLAHFELEIVLIIIYCYMCPVQQGTAEIPLQTCPGQCSCQAVVCHQPFVPLAHGVAVIKGIHQFQNKFVLKRSNKSKWVYVDVQKAAGI